MSQPPGPHGPYPQHGYSPAGQPGGYPPQGGYSQGGPPQGYPPQGGYPQPGGYGPPGPPPGPKPKSPLPWILGGIGALVVIGGVVLLIVLLGGDDKDSGGGGGDGGSQAANTSTAEGAARGVVAAINSKNADAIVALTCEQMKPQMKMMALVLADPKSIPGLPQDLQGKMDAVQVSADFDRIEPQGDTQAKAYITFKMDGLPPEAAQYDMKPMQSMDFPFMLNNGTWQLCDPEGAGPAGG